MKNIYKIVSLIVFTLFISGCGNTDTTSISIEVISCDNSNSQTATNDCGDSNIPDYYTCIQENDLLIKDDSNTIVKIISDTQDSKKVCVLSGSAHLER